MHASTNTQHLRYFHIITESGTSLAKPPLVHKKSDCTHCMVFSMWRVGLLKEVVLVDRLPVHYKAAMCGVLVSRDRLNCTCDTHAYITRICTYMLRGITSRRVQCNYRYDNMHMYVQNI